MSFVGTNADRHFTAALVGRSIAVDASYAYSPVLKEARASWDALERRWLLPLNWDSVDVLRGVRGAQIDAAIVDALGADPREKPRPVSPCEEYMPVKVKPYEHQREAFSRAMGVFRNE